MSATRGKYEALVAADSALDAIAIAREALPRGAAVLAEDAVLMEGDADRAWHVTLRFRKASDEKEKGEY